MDFRRLCSNRLGLYSVWISIEPKAVGLERKQLQFQLQMVADRGLCDSPPLGDIADS